MTLLHCSVLFIFDIYEFNQQDKSIKQIKKFENRKYVNHHDKSINEESTLRYTLANRPFKVLSSRTLLALFAVVVVVLWQETRNTFVSRPKRFVFSTFTDPRHVVVNLAIFALYAFLRRLVVVGLIWAGQALVALKYWNFAWAVSAVVNRQIVYLILWAALAFQTLQVKVFWMVTTYACIPVPEGFRMAFARF